MVRRVLIALLLAAVLVAPTAAVAAAGHTPPRSQAAEPGVFVRAWQALLSLFAPLGPDMDPDGAAKLGPGMDPDGARNPTGTATTPTVDNGPDMDPNGK